MLFNLGSLAGSIYLNGLFMGLCRLCTSLFITIFDIFVPSCGRRTFHTVGMGTIGICLACIVSFQTLGMKIEQSNLNIFRSYILFTTHTRVHFYCSELHGFNLGSGVYDVSRTISNCCLFSFYLNDLTFTDSQYCKQFLFRVCTNWWRTITAIIAT